LTSITPIRLRPGYEKYLQQFMEPESSWYRRWYFELRLEEEMLRSARHSRDLSLLILRLRRLDDLSGEQEEDHFLLLSHIANNRLRATDIPGRLAADEYAIVLPETGPAGAEIVASRLTDDLADYIISCKIRNFPDDGVAVDELLRTTDQSDNVVELAQFRRN
jgi:GGDEF domain-containing protein